MMKHSKPRRINRCFSYIQCDRKNVSSEETMKPFGSFYLPQQPSRCGKACFYGMVKLWDGSGVGVGVCVDEVVTIL